MQLDGLARGDMRVGHVIFREESGDGLQVGQRDDAARPADTHHHRVILLLIDAKVGRDGLQLERRDFLVVEIGPSADQFVVVSHGGLLKKNSPHSIPKALDSLVRVPVVNGAWREGANRKDAKGGANHFGLYRSHCGFAADYDRSPPFRASRVLRFFLRPYSGPRSTTIVVGGETL